jgi:hypothetical protein
MTELQQRQFDFVAGCIKSCKHDIQLQYAKLLIEQFAKLNPSLSTEQLEDLYLNQDITIALDR